MENKQVPLRVFTDAEEALIRSMFKGDKNEDNLKVLRKAFLPIYNMDGQIGVAVDFWTGENYEDMDEVKRQIAILARIKIIKAIEQGLVMLRAVANREDETPTQQAKRLKADSTK